MPVANTFSAALDLIGRNSYGSTKLLEVNADGSIRTQNWKEKLGNFGARITRNYDLRKDTKDAAVAHALERFANAASASDNPEIRGAVETFNRLTPDFIARYRDAKQRVEQRNAPRTAAVVAAPTNPVHQAAVSSIHTHSASNAAANTVSNAATNAPNYGATAQTNNPATTSAATPAGPTPIDLTALARKYQVNTRVAGFLLGSGPGFGKVIKAYTDTYKGAAISWEDAVVRKYADLLNKTYEQEAVFVAAGNRPAIADHEILAWAVTCLKQAQP